MTRDEGIQEMMDDSAYPESQMIEDRDYILKKLDISLNEWNEIMDAPKKTEDDYKNNKRIMYYISEIKRKTGL